ncbi:MAG: flavin reductase [Herpetosiphonaceae bacterium]|nr:MAG: flavin reductase [Herpetosiphonaceae bacterium]
MDPAAKKAVLRLFTYGMYVVTTANAEDRGAFTANWLTQCSFEPPMVAVAVENDSHSIEVMRTSGRFAVNVLPSGSREIAGHFGKHHKKVGDKLAGRTYDRSPGGCPVLEEALGYVECEVRGTLPAGDHTIFVGEVVEAQLLREGEPLTMKETGFRYSG